jgi:hypothetical protein
MAKYGEGKEVAKRNLAKYAKWRGIFAWSLAKSIPGEDGILYSWSEAMRNVDCRQAGNAWLGAMRNYSS